MQLEQANAALQEALSIRELFAKSAVSYQTCVDQMIALAHAVCQQQQTSK